MAMIFPGMDPYLEDPQLWTGVHARFVVGIADQLNARMGRRYVASVEERVWVEGPNREIVPDTWIMQRAGDGAGGGAVAVLEMEDDVAVAVRLPPLEIHETYVAILDRQSGWDVITLIEVISPANKYAGPGRDSYLRKQAEALAGRTHLVEVDLLRHGPHVAAVAEWAARGRGRYDYLACVNRAVGLRDLYELYPRTLRHRLPRVAVPLAGGDPDVRMDLGAVLAQAYDAGRSRDRLRYDRPCVPPLSAEDQAWADGLIAAAPPAE